MTDKRHHKALPMANWDAEVLASGIENCRWNSYVSAWWALVDYVYYSSLFLELCWNNRHINKLG